MNTSILDNLHVISRAFTRRSILSASLLTAAAVLSMPEMTSAASPSVLKVVPGYDVTVYDPIAASNAGTNNYAYMVYDTLFAFDEASRPQPQMVESYDVSSDGLTYRFTLRPGLEWHNGKPVTSADVIPSIRRWGARDSYGRLLIARLDDLRAVDDRVFEIKLKEPFPLLTTALARTSGYGAFIMPKEVAETDATKPITDTTGSGPYIFLKDETVPGAKLVFKKNEKYVPRAEPANGLAGGKAAHFDRIEWIIISDPVTAVSALQRGEVDVVERPLQDLLSQIEAAPDLTTTLINPVGRQEVLRPNHLQPPFDNVKARQALLSLVNQEDYLQAIVGDPRFFKTCVTIYMCGSAFDTTAGAEALNKPNPERAIALFKEAGWDFSKPIVIHQPTDNHPHNVSALVTAQKLRDIGLTVKLLPMDWATVSSSRNNKGPVESGGWNITFTHSPVGFSGNPLTNDFLSGVGEKGRWGWPKDEAIEKLLNDYLNAKDSDAQQKLAADIHKRAYEIVTHIPLGQFTQPIAHKRNLSGFVQSSDVWVYWNVKRNP